MKKTFVVFFAIFAMLFAGQALANDVTTDVDVGSLISQGQGQGQAIIDNSIVHGSDLSQAIVDNSIVHGSDLSRGRGFAIPGEVIFPGTPGYFGEATPGHRFIPLNKLLRFTTVWDADKAAAMLNGRTGNKDVQIRDLFASFDTDPAKKVYCSISDPADLGGTVVDQVSIGTVAATNKKSISADVLATAIVAASKRGANFILFMAEGVNREIDAQGFGIGLNYTKATLTGSDNGSSGVGSGGVGYSRGWSGYIDYPWLQFTILNVTGIDNLPIATVPAQAAVVEASLVDTIDDVVNGKEDVSPTNYTEAGQTSDRIKPVD